MNLDDVSVNETVIIDFVDTEKTLKKRLQDIGFIKGSEVTLLYSSPSGSPKAYLIKGAVIALRKNDCKNIFVLSRKSECD